jgi:uncharacterized membrane protein YkvA (DUF1232 family)
VSEPRDSDEVRSTDGETAVTADYLQLLKDQVARYIGTLRDVVILAPIYAVLMFHLQDDPRLEPQHRLWVEAAIGYLVSPHDVIPEDEVGPYGYLDDIFCCAFVVNRIAEELGWEVVEEGWTGEGSALEVSKNVLAREVELLGYAGDDVLKFAGLDGLSEGAEQERTQATRT